MQPAIILSLLIYFTWSVSFVGACFFTRRTSIAIALAALGLPGIYFAHMLTLVFYFDLAIWFAVSETEIDGIVGGDGAKLVFHGLIVAPFCSVMLVCIGMATYVARRAS